MEQILINAKLAQKELLNLTIDEKNLCLKKISNCLKENIDKILDANKIDIINAKENGLSEAMIDRLLLNEKRIINLANDIDNIIALPNYVGNILEEIKRPNGLVIKKVSVPFGVIAVIFESRPNVCVDIASLTLKTGNACVLKGGKEAINTNKALVEIMQNAISDIVDKNVISLIIDTSREVVNKLICMKEYVDLLIPRGGKGLIDYIVNNSKVPYIETGAGNCHLYIHSEADLDMALRVAVNAKYQRPSVCNAIENILVDRKIATLFLPKLYDEFNKLGIEIRGCEKTCNIIDVKKATSTDFYTEYNDYIVSIMVVDDIDSAISHINQHSSKHSEAIITSDLEAKDKFFMQIDSACVYHNASTRFTDGGCFGFGAEIGISTAKLHARGPMGLREITTYKYIIEGNGEIR